jgi:hypothetical protein
MTFDSGVSYSIHTFSYPGHAQQLNPRTGVAPTVVLCVCMEHGVCCHCEAIAH